MCFKVTLHEWQCPICIICELHAASSSWRSPLSPLGAFVYALNFWRAGSSGGKGELVIQILQNKLWRRAKLRHQHLKVIKDLWRTAKLRHRHVEVVKDFYSNFPEILFVRSCGICKVMQILIRRHLFGSYLSEVFQCLLTVFSAVCLPWEFRIRSSRPPVYYSNELCLFLIYTYGLVLRNRLN